MSMAQNRGAFASLLQLQRASSLESHLQHEVLDDPVEGASLVVERFARGSLALVTFAQVKEVRTRLGARIGEQLDRDALRLLAAHLPAGEAITSSAQASHETLTGVHLDGIF